MFINKFRIGCDPEFSYILERRGARQQAIGMPAYWFVPRMAGFGYEGGAVAELRPTEHWDPLVVTGRIYQLLKKGYDACPVLRNALWLAGSHQGVGPTGGHIHIDCNEIDSTMGDVASAFDHYIYYGWEIGLGDARQREERRTSGYGGTGRWRNEDDHLEYRGIGSFVASPAATLAVLSLAKLVFYGVTRGAFRGVSWTADTPSQGNSPGTCRRKLRDLKSILGRDFHGNCDRGWRALLRLLDGGVDWNANMIDTWGLRR